MPKLAKIAKQIKDIGDIERAKRMQEQGYVRGMFRGGKKPNDGPYFTPDEQAAHEFGARFENTDVREYALQIRKPFRFDGFYSSSEVENFRSALLERKVKPKIVEELIRIPREDYGDAMPGSALWQILETQSGDAMGVIGKSGYDAIDARQEVIMLRGGLGVRDANLAQFDPKNANKNDIYGAVDPRLLTPIAAGSSIGVAAQMYGDSPEVQRVYQEFVDRRNKKQEIWRKIRQGGEALRTIGQGVVAGIASDAYRLGGYLTPESVENTNAQADTLQANMMHVPTEENVFIDEFGRQIEQFDKDIQPLVRGFKQTPIYKAYEMLPERAKAIVDVAGQYITP